MRSDEDAVLAIMTTGLTSEQVWPFLLTANLLVTNHLSSSGLGATTLAEIEKYLAAHLASVRSKFGIREKIGEAEVWTGYQGGPGLQATPYGETVLMLDTTGTLASKMSGKTVDVATFDFDLDDDD